MKKTTSGQLAMHWEKVELIREYNPELAEKITEFTNTLIDCDFKGAFEVDDDVYHNGIGISQSRFGYLKKSPFFYHYKTYKDIGSNVKRPKHFIEGDFIHRVFLERKTVNDLFVSESPIMRLVYEAKPETKNARATSIYKEKVAQHRLDGKEVISEDLFDQMNLFDDFIKNEPILKNVFDNGISEKAFYSICPKTGLIRKCKTDFLIPCENGQVSIFDLKSTKSIDSDNFEWSIYNYRYNTQAAYYIDIVQDAINTKIKDYLLFTIEKDAPFEFDLGFMDEPSLEAGRTGNKNGYYKFMDVLADCYEKREFKRNTLEIKAYGIPHSKMNDELLGL